MVVARRPVSIYRGVCNKYSHDLVKYALQPGICNSIPEIALAISKIAHVINSSSGTIITKLRY